ITDSWQACIQRRLAVGSETAKLERDPRQLLTRLKLPCPGEVKRIGDILRATDDGQRETELALKLEWRSLEQLITQRQAQIGGPHALLADLEAGRLRGERSVRGKQHTAHQYEPSDRPGRKLRRRQQDRMPPSLHVYVSTLAPGRWGFSIPHVGDP